MVLFRVFLEKAQKDLSLDMKVTDGAIGSIVGFDPSDTSNWRNGKKVVLNAILLRTLMKKLHIEESVINSILDGNIPEKYTREITLWKLRGVKGDARKTGGSITEANSIIELNSSN